MSTTPRRVFLSRVSREFGLLAEDLRNLLQSTGHAARTQLSFRQEPDATTTLSKLSQYIHDSDTVLSLVGKLSGGYPPDTALDDPIHPAPPGGTAAKTWRDLLPGGFTKLSYTQWEVILARFWKKTLFFYFRSPKLRTKAPQPADDDLPHQELFASDLTKTKGLDRDYFATADQLKVLVLETSGPPPPSPRRLLDGGPLHRRRGRGSELAAVRSPRPARPPLRRAGRS